MACRKAELRNEQRSKNAAAPPSVAVSDALLFTMICIIGLPVDVHAKDGSVYSGIFHTASFDNDYAVVLKKARMIKKGNLEANVINGTLIETLVVRSGDLVQVVAKGVPLPSDGITGYAGGDGIEATAGRNEYLNMNAEVIKSNESKGNKKHKSQTRFSDKRENGFPHKTAKGGYLDEHNERSYTIKMQIGEVHNLSVVGRQVHDASQEIKSDGHSKPGFLDSRTTNEVRGSSLSSASLEDQSTAAVNILEEKNRQQTPKGVSTGQAKPTSDKTACRVVSPQKSSVASIPIVDVNSKSSLSASSNSFPLVPPKSSSFNRTAKESKLNAGAKTFSPSMLHHKTVTTPAVPNGASVSSYIPGTYTIAPISTAQEAVDANSYARSSLPVKFVPYNNAAIGNGGHDAQYVQPIIGQMVNRGQPVRYAAGQYHNFQTGPTYVHQNPQNVMLGRMGPLVCMHPIPSDVVQSAAGFSPIATRPHLTPHQMHLSKHQVEGIFNRKDIFTGNAPAQAMQLYMNPPIIASGPQQFVMPNSIPISQPLYPLLRPIAVPGSHGFLSTKFA